jgi:hypothetical protein
VITAENAFQKNEWPFFKKRKRSRKLERVLDRSILERIPILLERCFFLKKGQSLFWNAFFTVLFYGYFSLGCLGRSIRKMAFFTLSDFKKIKEAGGTYYTSI